MKKLLIALSCSVGLLGACSNANEKAEDQREAKAEASAAASGSAIAALGLTEMQLLDADIVDANGADLGDVEGVVRGANGQVDRLLVEIDGSNPDRFVHVPINDLKPLVRGNDTDLSTALTKAQLSELPAVNPAPQ